MLDYGIDIWANKNFVIKEDKVYVNYKSSPSLLEIVEQIRESGLRGPLLIRFPHLIKKQINNLYEGFKHAIKENEYNGQFQAVFPLKVNQFPGSLDAILEYGSQYGYGLEAGSKAELVLAMALLDKQETITVNGFKDAEMITLGFIAAQMKHNITLTIEGLGELESIIEIAKSTKLNIPNIGIRVRLNSVANGLWAKSGGMAAKFGLTSTELLEAIALLKENKLIKYLTMIHFHIGSQLEDIAPTKRALREAGNIYAEMRLLGAKNLKAINIGGGLAIEYAQHENKRVCTYTLQEFCNDVVFHLKEVMDAKDVEHPTIYTESGRFIAASHTVLVAPVLELFSQDYQEKSLRLKKNNPPLIEELCILNKHINYKTCKEYMHDALDHMESLFKLFELGYIDLQDRSNGEILVQQIVKKALYLRKDSPLTELKKLEQKMQERYLINVSFFQSLPDYWGLKQNFPVIPIHKLDQPAIRAACLWDITCDSDGEIAYDPEAPLYLHDIDLDNEDYFLGFFNLGAYQETLGMNHNLFVKPSECCVDIDEKGFNISSIKESKSILKILNDLGYDEEKIVIDLKNMIAQVSFNSEEEKSDTLQKLELFLHQNGYLRTTQ